jgi:hypothetical protein
MKTASPWFAIAVVAFVAMPSFAAETMLPVADLKPPRSEWNAQSE